MLGEKYEYVLFYIFFLRACILNELCFLRVCELGA